MRENIIEKYDFVSLHDHPKSLVRNQVLYILAANAQWDEENRFDTILSDYLAHITDEKPTYQSIRTVCDR